MRRPKTKVRGVIDKEETGARGLFKVISDAGIVGWISDNED
jgi:isochorismate synthase EntC